MPAKINLLPKDLLVSKKASAAAQKLKTISIVAATISFFVGVAGIVSVFYFQDKVNKLAEEKQNLTSTVLSLESAEQGLVLLKNRGTALSQLMSARAVETSYVKQKKLAESIPPAATLKQIETDTGQSSISIVTRDSATLTQIMKSLTREQYGTVVLDAITFSPTLGYELKVQVF